VFQLDIDSLVDSVTATIMARLSSADGAKVVVFGEVPGELLAAECVTTAGMTFDDAAGADFIVMTAQAFRACHGGGLPSNVAPAAGSAAGPACGTASAGGKDCGSDVDLRSRRLVSERELKAACPSDGCVVHVGPKTLVTALARDYAQSHGFKIVKD
jgi:hypothetical protein